VDKAREKIDSIGEMTKERYQNWKRVLSGTLNDPQLVLSLGILSVFYVFLTGFNSTFGEGISGDENELTCNCETSHRAYYLTMVIISILVWGVGFFLIAIYDAYKFWRFRDKAKHPEKYIPKMLLQSSETQELSVSFLERTVNSVEAKAQAIMKIPVKSLVTKTLDIVDDGVETLRVIDDGPGLKSLQKNPIDTILTMTLESVKDSVVYKLQDETDNENDKEESKSKPIAELIQDTTELIDVARQNSILGKVVKPLDEKVQAAKKTVAGSILTNLITSTVKIEQESPVDDNKQASLMVKENPSTQEENVHDTEMKLVAHTTKSSTAASSSMPETPTKIAATNDEVVTVKQEGDNDLLVMNLTDDNIKKAPVESLSTITTPLTTVTTAENIQKQSVDAEETFSSEKIATSSKTNNRKQSVKFSEATNLSPEDQKALQRIKHYENFLWLEFYKVYSVGANTEDDSNILPPFVKILGDSGRGETSGSNVVSDTKPLLQVSFYDDSEESSFTVIEPDGTADKDSNVEDYAKDVSAASNSAKSSMAKKATLSPKQIKKNKRSFATSTTMQRNDKVSSAKHQDDTPRLKSSATKSGTQLKPSKSELTISSQIDNNEDEDDDNDDDNDDDDNDDDDNNDDNDDDDNDDNDVDDDDDDDDNDNDDEDDDDDDDESKSSVFGSWVDLRPQGLYTDIGEDNTAWLVADVTCASFGFFLYPFLIAVRLLAQLGLVPLLLFQTLGTYPWICITDNYYCRNDVNQYRLGIDKAALVFTFYCCILIAVLSTAILRWFPCSKDARSASANCIS